MSRTCEGCGGPNQRSEQAKYCSDSCRQKSYGQTEKGKATRKAYSQTEKCKAQRKAYSQTERRQAVRKAYNRSENGRNRHRANRYGLTNARLEELLAAGCYAPNCAEKEKLHIDHDHACCPANVSCGNCVRGALCRRHNVYLGYLEADWQFAIWAMRQPSLVLKVRREA